MNRKSLARVHTHTHMLLLDKVNGLFVESKNLSFLNMLKIKANKLEPF